MESWSEGDYKERWGLIFSAIWSMAHWAGFCMVKGGISLLLSPKTTLLIYWARCTIRGLDVTAVPGS